MSQILMKFAPDVHFDAKTRKPVSKFWYQYLVAMETGKAILAILVQFDHENVWKMQ